jgi:hypothetical protein
MLRLAKACIAVASMLACGAVQALKVEQLESRYEAGRYLITVQVVLDAAPSAVGAVLKDYEAYPVLDPSIRSSERVGVEPDGTILLRTRIQACEGLFCRRVMRVERIAEAPDSLLATVIPGRSEVRRGVTRTSWQAQDGGTLVNYHAEFEPDFWVPAVIGRRFAGHTLRESTLELFRNVEERARGQ